MFCPFFHLRILALALLYGDDVLNCIILSLVHFHTSLTHIVLYQTCFLLVIKFV